MAPEHSCGFILFREPEEGKRYYLLLHYRAGHWDFPKGHVEEGEGEIQTAMRELEEETGIKHAEVREGFRHEYSYVFGSDGKHSKKVTFYLAKTDESRLRFSHEHQGGRWVTFESAMKLLTFDNARAMLEKAENFLPKGNPV
jgi:bis(5'-nucleosidyl)-tetraphosphatase